MEMTCPVCRTRFTRPPGTRTIYCGSSCRTARERQLARAQRDLARDAEPSDANLRQALADVECLAVTWGPPPGVVVVGFDDLCQKHWGETVPPRLVPPSPKARAALAARQRHLHARLREATRREERQQLQQAQVQRMRAGRRAAAEDDAAWRRELAGGL